MNATANEPGPMKMRSRRKLISGMVVALGGIAGSTAWAAAQQPATQQIASPGADPKRTALHYQADYRAGPVRIYEVLLDAKLFAALTGLPAEIDPKAGGEFSLFGAQIEGRNIELLPNQRIVQAWRPTHWDPGIYSIVKFDLKPRGAESTLKLDHTGFPEGDADHLDLGWHEHYLEPMRKYFQPS